LEFLSF